jgi:hypothetical protein
MSKSENMKNINVKNQGPLGWVFFVAWVGAVVYFVNESTGFWGFILAILKACVWPAYVVHDVLQMIGA